MIDRPRRVGRMIDHMSMTCHGRDHIDAARIGVFGFRRVTSRYSPGRAVSLLRGVSAPIFEGALPSCERNREADHNA